MRIVHALQTELVIENLVELTDEFRKVSNRNRRVFDDRTRFFVARNVGHDSESGLS